MNDQPEASDREPRQSVRTVRPRRGDLEAATHRHPFRPSGEFTGASWVEVCDLCGLSQRGPGTMHPDSAVVS
jgi:hypothetical protein